MANVLETLIKASERAACIARSCCSASTSEALLIAEKGVKEANSRFSTDFKTIADVLAQESAKSEIGAQYPELAENVRGEECSEIGGVNIALRKNAEETAELLSSLIPMQAAMCMAEAAHREIDIPVFDLLPTNIPSLNTKDLGVWIDPIDATAEFIAGVRGEADADKGLPCVTVLIGAYLRSTGEPVIGVINQPFYNGKSRIVWGVCYNGAQVCGGTDIDTDSESKLILMSAAEDPDVVEKVKSLGWDVKSVPGAGHKLMKVALGEAAAYIVSKGTTFRWDTCAPHSILKARGGEILDFTTKLPITYNDPKDVETRQYCNTGGVIAYCNKNVYEKLDIFQII